MCSVTQPGFTESALFKRQRPAAKEADKSLSTQNLESDGPCGRNAGQQQQRTIFQKRLFQSLQDFIKSERFYLYAGGSLVRLVFLKG